MAVTNGKALHKSYVGKKANVDIYTNTRMLSANNIHTCSYTCARSESCSGFNFTEYTHNCELFTCLDPRNLDNNQAFTSIQFYAENNLAMNESMAQGKLLRFSINLILLSNFYICCKRRKSLNDRWKQYLYNWIILNAFYFIINNKKPRWWFIKKSKDCRDKIE